jgi:2,3-bisphosphoglycerate-dependent phosphoglycerate mutase
VRTLLLVRHAAPVVDAALPSARWSLSSAGRAACRPLADALAPLAPGALVTSVEPKAIETGALLAAALDVPVTTGTDLHEHDRTGVPVLAPDAWRDAMAHFFAHPDDRVLGRESAREATDRFAGAVERALATTAAATLGLVSHGTVMSLFAARHGAGDAHALWRRLTMPCALVLEVPSFGLRAVIDGDRGGA